MEPTLGDICHAVIIPEYRLSVQGAIYWFLHAPNLNRFLKGLNNLEKYPLFQGGAKQLKKCHLIFNSGSRRVQTLLAQYCSDLGLITGVVDAHNIRIHKGFDHIFTWKPLFPINKEIQQKVIEESTQAFSSLRQYRLNKWQNEHGLDYLIEAAEMIEAYAGSLRIMLDKIKPRAVILEGVKAFSEVAVQIACKDTGTFSLAIPHGFLGRPVAYIDTSAVISYSPHHNDYLKTLCTSSTKVEPLGWFEPASKFAANINDAIRTPPKTTNKLQILFLSSYKGAKEIRCPSIYDRIPQVIEVLNSMPEVEKVIFRLHGGEKFPEAQNLINNCINPKLSITWENKIPGETLLKNLMETNMIISLYSTGLLYGPYLNRRAVEIRDDSINSVWGCSVLPQKNTYKIQNTLKPGELKDFIKDAEVIKGSEFLYNWCREKEAFSEMLAKLSI